MLVYGDRSERADPRHRLDEIDRKIGAVGAMPSGLERHSALTEVLIETGRILQGVADAEFAIAGCDRWSATTIALADFLQSIAAAFCRSWDSKFKAEPPLGPSPSALHLPASVRMRVPEGYAYYALYPEAYVVAARSLGLDEQVRVIGLRSIGTSLGAVAAAAIGAPRSVTVRPFGAPYAREIAVSDELASELLGDSDTDFLIVDEGPGRSGSSFGAVADWLERRGVAEERIAFLPSHSRDLGPHANTRHRNRWQRARKAVASFERGWPEPLSQWCKSRSDGEWKFAGLGVEGVRKLERARTLHAAGLAPEPIGLAHGFLIERSYEDAGLLPPGAKPLPGLAYYIGTRARLLPAEHPGASLRELLRMAQRNVTLGLGAPAASRLDEWADRLPRLQARVVATETDNRLDRHKWLKLPDGRLLKSDAVGHCQSHDLVGCQDVSWDVAGAAVEFDLNEPDLSWLADEVAATAGRRIDRELLRFMTITYLAFRFGHATFASEMPVDDPAELRRLRVITGQYRDRLETLLLQQTQVPTPQLSSVDAAGE